MPDQTLHAIVDQRPRRAARASLPSDALTASDADALSWDPELAADQQVSWGNADTLALVPDFTSGVSGRQELFNQANTFAANQGAVGLQGGRVVIGVPTRTQVKDLAIFCHGEPWGMGSDASNDLSRDDLHTADASGKRYPTPMGQECFGDPAHARELLHADWTNNWNPTRLASVRPAGR